MGGDGAHRVPSHGAWGRRLLLRGEAGARLGGPHIHDLHLRRRAQGERRGRAQVVQRQ